MPRLCFEGGAATFKQILCKLRSGWLLFVFFCLSCDASANLRLRKANVAELAARGDHNTKEMRCESTWASILNPGVKGVSVLGRINRFYGTKFTRVCY